MVAIRESNTDDPEPGRLARGRRHIRLVDDQSEILPVIIDPRLDALGLAHDPEHPNAAGGIGYGLAAARALSGDLAIAGLANVMDEFDAAIGGRRDEAPFLHDLVDAAVVVFRHIMGRH